MVMLHLFTFDPAWVHAEGRRGVGAALLRRLCALCHGAVRFVLAEDPEGAGLSLRAPGQRGLPRRWRRGPRRPARQPGGPHRRTGALLTRSEGVLHILERLGGLWRVARRSWADSCLGRCATRPTTSWPAVRYRVFGRKDDACPLIPAALRGRFDL